MILLEIPASREWLGLARRLVQDIAEPRIGRQQAEELALAVGEALANAVEHGSPGGSRDRVSMVVGEWTGRVVVVVRDEGVGFDASLVPDPTVDQERGRGVWLIRRLTAAEWADEGWGMSVRMAKGRGGPR